MEKNILPNYWEIIIVCTLTGFFFSSCSGHSSSSNFSQEELKQFRQNFQITENIIAELELIHEKTKTRQRPIKIKITNRRPRHVWHKARWIYFSIQNLRSHNGLKSNELSQKHSDDIGPTEVYDLLHIMQEDLRELSNIFNIEERPTPAPLPKKALPQDVYRNLYRINQMIHGIDNRTTTPGHVYQTANNIVGQLRQIYRHEGIAKPIATLQPSEGKHPRDVYKQVHLLHNQLKVFSKKQGQSISGDVEMLEMKLSRIIPSDVLDVLINVLADVDALRASMGILLSPELPIPPNITPSRVFDIVSEGVAILESML